MDSFNLAARRNTVSHGDRPPGVPGGAMACSGSWLRSRGGKDQMF